MSASLFPGGLELGGDANGFDGFDGFDCFDGFEGFDGLDGFDGFDGFNGFNNFLGFDCFTGFARSGGRRPVWYPSHDLASRNSSVGLSLICPKSTHSLGMDEGERQQRSFFKALLQYRHSEGG